MSGDPPLGCYVPFPAYPYQPPGWSPTYEPVLPVVRDVPAPSVPPIVQLSDADVDRIARRVVELLRQPPVDPDAQALVDKVVADNMPKATKKRPITRRK